MLSLLHTGNRTIFLAILLLPWAARGQGDVSISEDMVSAHNRVRSQLNLPGLVWSEELAAYARQWAQHLAADKGCRLKHRPSGKETGRQYGENLYWASSIRYDDGTREMQEVGAAEVVASWAGEAADFDYERNRCREGSVCGHYTQIVWRTTKQVGCARTLCPDKGQIWVCNYAPAGNIVGQRPY